jgi:hypothetical protein
MNPRCRSTALGSRLSTATEKRLQASDAVVPRLAVPIHMLFFESRRKDRPENQIRPLPFVFAWSEQSEPFLRVGPAKTHRPFD